MMRAFLGFFLILTTSAWAKPRVASINMCTDQLVLALADDEQILGVSSLSRDQTLSYFHRRAAQFPVLSGTAEDVMALRPDVVVTATFAKPQTRVLLRASGLHIAEFADSRTLSEVKDQIRRMGALLDQRLRAGAAIAAIEKAELAARNHAQTPLSVLPLERRGWITGRDTLLTDVLTLSGFHNLGADNVAYGERLPLEKLVGMTPDRLLLHRGETRAEDQGSALLRHPALAHLAAKGRITLPNNLLICAGPMVAEALMLLRAAR